MMVIVILIKTPNINHDKISKFIRHRIDNLNIIFLLNNRSASIYTVKEFYQKQNTISTMHLRSTSNIILLYNSFFLFISCLKLKYNSLLNSHFSNDIIWISLRSREFLFHISTFHQVKLWTNIGLFPW